MRRRRRSGLELMAAAAVVTVALSALAAIPAKAAQDSVEELAQDAEQVDEDRVDTALTRELGEPKYQLDRSFWQRIQEWLARVWVRFLQWVESVSRYVGGPVVLAVLVSGAVVVIVFAVTANLGRRRARVVEERIRLEHEAAKGLDPVELERRAAHAEASQDYELAFRLLFRAGLIRLDRAGRIDLRPGTTSGLVAERLHTPAFDRLVTRFDSVVYGGADPSPADPDLVRDVMEDLLGRSRL